LKTVVDGQPIEGTPEELARYVKTYRQMTGGSSKTGGDQGIPALDSFVSYLEIKGGNMEHTWDEIQEKVIGRKLKSDAKGQAMYRFAYSRYQAAKDRIEKDLKGKFKAEKGVFRFQK